MSLIDHRTKPETMWAYYVVDHLPTMANIYRFDTPEEAIAFYQSLDPSLRSAIGSNMGGVYRPRVCTVQTVSRQTHYPKAFTVMS